MSDAGGARLGVVDEIFLRGHRGLGTPNVLQGLWRTADRVEPELLHRLHDALRTGELGRRVVRSRVPGARPSWRPNLRAHPLVLASEPLTAAQSLTWADGLGDDLDPEFGPGWRLAATPLRDGGTIIALTCSHVLADARGLVHAAHLALDQLAEEGDRASADRSKSAAEAGSDWLDAARQWSIVLGGTVHALTHGLRGDDKAVSGSPLPQDISASGQLGSHSGRTRRGDGDSRYRPGSRSESHRTDDALVSAARTRRPGRTAGPPGGRRHRTHLTDPLPVHSVAARCQAETWDRVAEQNGGTANSLFIHLVAEALRTAGVAQGFDWAGIEASLPVDTRDEPRVANDIAMTSVVVEPSDDPATLRAKARASYERRITAPARVPEEILQVVGDRLAHRMAAGAGERDVLCSNIGDLPERLLTFGPHRCLGVAARAIHPGLTVGARPRTRLSGYLCRIGPDYTLCLVALDPPGIGSPEALAEVAGRVASGLGLPLSFW